MGKRLSNLWIYSCLAAIMLSCWQCKPESDSRTREVKKYLEDRYGVKLDKKTERIYVINDKGCGNCILSLSEFVKQNVNDAQALIIIHSRGTNVDLSAFEEKAKWNPNIIINHQIINDENDPFCRSSVVYLKDEKVDTIINIGDGDIYNQLEYIFKKKQ